MARIAYKRVYSPFDLRKQDSILHNVDRSEFLRRKQIAELKLVKV
jgi:hypothetical protein